MAAGNLYPSPNEISACVEARRSTLTEKLQEERHRLHSRIEEIDHVLSALNENPQIQTVLDLLQKTRCL